MKTKRADEIKIRVRNIHNFNKLEMSQINGRVVFLLNTEYISEITAVKQIL